LNGNPVKVGMSLSDSDVPKLKYHLPESKVGRLGQFEYVVADHSRVTKASIILNRSPKSPEVPSQVTGVIPSTRIKVPIPAPQDPDDDKLSIIIAASKLAGAVSINGRDLVPKVGPDAKWMTLTAIEPVEAATPLEYYAASAPVEPVLTDFWIQVSDGRGG